MAENIVNINEFQQLAKTKLPKMHYDFISGGAEDQQTLNENTEAFCRIKLFPRVLIDVSNIDISTSLLSYRISSPIIIAPMSRHTLVHPGGEFATTKAAAACNTILILSTMSSYTVEEVASSSCNAVLFLQLYVFKKRSVSVELVKRAEACGYKAIVLTVDVPRLGRRESDTKNRMVSVQIKNFKDSIPTETQSAKGSGIEAFTQKTLDASLTWKDVEWLRSVTKLPILVKGILNRHDALKAVEACVDGIIVSNHGGRQLDHTPATITVLEEVVNGVNGKIPVLVDGGIRRGTDIFKALALGAQAVLIGRPVMYGLAVKGEEGVKEVIEMLKNELEITMALSGCPTIEDISRNHVRTEQETVKSKL